MTRAERKARHAAANKQIWEAAEQPESFHFLDTKGDVPLKSEFKPSVKVLSRKPIPKIAARDAAGGIAGLTLDDEDDSETEARKRNEASLAERQRKAQIEREEKQRKYAEVRERLFGSAGSRDASESPALSSRSPTGGQTRGSRKGRSQVGRGSQPESSAEQSPARQSNQKQLYDPDYKPKNRGEDSPRSTAPKKDQPIRMPKGPDSSGRGGFGFATRGARSGV